MCIYCGTKNYRKIYKNHYGEIPKDKNGRSYHIHHKDGRRTNNSPDNLVALSLQDHYDVHYSQGDWAAAMYLAALLKVDPSEIKNIRSRQQMKTGAEHHRYGIPHTESVKEHLRQTQLGTKKPGTSKAHKGKVRPKHSLSISGKSNGRYDHTLKDWKNLESGQVVSMTRSEFIKMTGAKEASVSGLIHGRSKSCSGWTLIK